MLTLYFQPVLKVLHKERLLLFKNQSTLPIQTIRVSAEKNQNLMPFMLSNMTNTNHIYFCYYNNTCSNTIIYSIFQNKYKYNRFMVVAVSYF